MEGTLYNPSEPERQPLRPVLVLERWQVELELQLVGQRVECDQPLSRSRNCLISKSRYLSAFSFSFACALLLVAHAIHQASCRLHQTEEK
jgi:hypothetical protein